MSGGKGEWTPAGGDGGAGPSRPHGLDGGYDGGGCGGAGSGKGWPSQAKPKGKSKGDGWEEFRRVSGDQVHWQKNAPFWGKLLDHQQKQILDMTDFNISLRRRKNQNHFKVQIFSGFGPTKSEAVALGIALQFMA